MVLYLTTLIFFVWRRKAGEAWAPACANSNVRRRLSQGGASRCFLISIALIDELIEGNVSLSSR